MPPSPAHLTIFHTNDMHGNLPGLSRLSTLCKRLRGEEELAGHGVLFMDAGDAADRKLEIVSNTKGAAFGPILNAMGYDVQALGNDLCITYGLQCIPAYSNGLKFKLLAANLRNPDGTSYNGVNPYCFFPLEGGGKLAVIGLTPQAADVYEFFGIEMTDPMLILKKLVEKLRSDGIGIIVVLSHSGITEDRRFAEAVPDIDLIIGGHSHTLLEHGELAGGVQITQAGDSAEFLGRVELSYDPETHRIIRCSTGVIRVSPDEIPDSLVLQAIAAAEAEVELLVNQPAANLADPLDLDHFGECAIGNFTADALRKRMDAELAIIHSGLFHTGLPAGMITIGQLRKASFSTANPGVTLLSGRQVLDALEAGRDPAVYEFMFKAMRGAPMGIPQVSGLKIWYTPGSESGHRISKVEVNGEILDPNRIYTVAHTDVEVSQYGCIHLQISQKPRYEMPTIVNEVMLDAMQASEPVYAPQSGRWINTSG